MIEIIWEFTIKEESRGQFELAFGPGGALSKLFAGASGFRGITLLREVKAEGQYLSVEVWDREDQRAALLVRQANEYAELQADFDDWSLSKRQVGVYRMLAEGTVRQRGRVKRRRL